MYRVVLFIIYFSLTRGKPKWQIVEVEDKESLLGGNSNENIDQEKDYQWGKGK